MPATTLPAPDARRALSRWMWPLTAAALATLYAVSLDNGLLSSQLSTSGLFLHELFHDGRHLLGVPCH